MERRVGHRFPGGSYRIEHWENFLLSDATGCGPLPDALAHPVHLFHVPINGAGTSIAELFALAAADGCPVSIDFYDWTLHAPLRENERYHIDGGITAFDREQREGGSAVDSFTYEIGVRSADAGRIAEVAFRWRYWRRG